MSGLVLTERGKATENGQYNRDYAESRNRRELAGESDPAHQILRFQRTKTFVQILISYTV